MSEQQITTIEPVHPQARFINLGALAPRALHAAYCGLAAAQQADAQPILVVAQSVSTHLCLGQSQTPQVELDIDACTQAGVEIVRRPLGGGTVLVDGDQHCIFFILPQSMSAARPARIFSYCLNPLARTFGRFDIAVRQVGRSDLWCGGSKIAGSGAATIGHSMVLGTSIVMDFPHALFSELVSAPSAEFRAWLNDALPEAFMPWQALATVPSEAVIYRALGAAVEETLGWRLHASAPSAAELHAMQDAEEELQRDLAEADDVPAARRVAHGIKLNASTFLTESGGERGWLRILIKNRSIARIAAQDAHACATLQACVGSKLLPAELHHRLERVMARDDARAWQESIALSALGTQTDEAAVLGDEA